MQRITVSLATPQRLSQALGAAPMPTATAPEQAPPQVAAAGPTLAQEREQVLEAARLEGRREGEVEAASTLQQQIRVARQALDEAHAERMQALAQEQQQLADLLASLPAALEVVQARVLEDAAVLAFEAVIRLFGDAAETDMQTLCAKLLAEHSERPVTLRVAPSHLAAIGALAGSQVRIVAAAGLAAGQVQLQTATGVIDGGLDVRLDALRAAFVTALGISDR